MLTTEELKKLIADTSTSDDDVFDAMKRYIAIEENERSTPQPDMASMAEVHNFLFKMRPAVQIKIEAYIKEVMSAT